jgi:hypothetical protein
MDFDHIHDSGLSGPTHTDVPGIGPVPTGPKASRRLSRGQKGETRWHDSDHEKKNSTTDVRRRRKEAFRSSVRRPSPAPDPDTAYRQISIPGSWRKLKNPSTPQDPHIKTATPGNDDRRRRESINSAKQVPKRSASPGMFYGSDEGEDVDDVEADASDNDSVYFNASEDVTGDYELDLGDESSEDDPPAKLEGPDICQCPINRQCAVRADHLIDCRALVFEWKKWNVTAQLDLNAVLNEAVPPVVAPFTTAEAVNKMHRHCARVARHPQAHVSDRSDYRRMVEWTADMHVHSITQEILNSTQILPLLHTFLNPPNANHHIQKRTPQNLLEETEVIFKKWTQKDLLADLNRGIIRTIKQTAGCGIRHSERIDPDWPYRMSDKFFGHGHLVNGQRWLSPLQMSRAGAHGAPVAGISGGMNLGARSIVMGLHDEGKKEFYADIDKGNTIWYVGTAVERLNIENDQQREETNVKDTPASRNRRNRRPTHATRALMKSRETGTPVRVFRSYRLAKIVAHRPTEGFRYDGLYRVVGQECLKKDRQIWRFKMRRLRSDDPEAGGQGPLRGTRAPRL